MKSPVDPKPTKRADADGTPKTTPRKGAAPRAKDGGAPYGARFSGIQKIPLGAKLVISIIVLLSVGTVSISLSIRQLVNSYMLQRTDSQLLQQAELVFKNTTLLNDTKSTADSNSFVSYYVQAYDRQTGSTYKLLQPMYRDGVISRPLLPRGGGLDGHEIAVPYTTPAVVDLENVKCQPDHETMVMAQAPWRVVALRWVSDSANGTIEPRGVIYIGLSLGNQVDMIDNLTRFCVIVGVAVVLLGGVISAITVQRTLSPLKRIEKTAAKIAAGDLSQRVPDAPEGTEVGTLAKSLNTMLAQIERSFRQQQATTEKMKRFVSDASHELRTPLAAIHGYAELYRMQRNEPGQIERADDSIAHIEASSARMTLLVEDLLSLARLDEGHGISITDHIDLGSVIRESVDDLHALDPERDITTGVLGLDVSEPDHLQLSMTPGELPSVMIVADGTRLHQMVTNIVGNIHRYTPADSPVELSLGVLGIDMALDELTSLASEEESLQAIVGAAARFTVTQRGMMVSVARFTDHGPGVPPDGLARIFERFYTADPSRARQKGGTGLGMAIAQSVINAHRGFICATESPGGGLTFTIVMPLAPDEAES